jgi:hypothetical protein
MTGNKCPCHESCSECMLIRAMRNLKAILQVVPGHWTWDMELTMWKVTVEVFCISSAFLTCGLLYGRERCSSQLCKCGHGCNMVFISLRCIYCKRAYVYPSGRNAALLPNGTPDKRKRRRITHLGERTPGQVLISLLHAMIQVSYFLH